MTEDQDYGQSHTFSSGIEVIILPFPSLRFEKFQKKSRQKYPEPRIPKKKIKVVDGEETIDDVTNEKYVAKKEEVDRNRNQWLSERILKICLRDCIVIDLDKYENVIAALEEDNEEPYPESVLDRQIEFLTEYVIRSASDFVALSTVSMQLMTVSDDEVAEQLDSFRGDVEGSTANGNEASGANEIERLEV